MSRKLIHFLLILWSLQTNGAKDPLTFSPIFLNYRAAFKEDDLMPILYQNQFP